MIVWLASYPRSGNTFFRVILNCIFGIQTNSLYGDKKDIAADKQTSELVGHKDLPDDFSIERAREQDTVYYIKTHELKDKRVAPDDKVIYLIRDGRESTLSFTFHQNIYSSASIVLRDTIYGNNFIGSWGEHVQSWDPENRDKTLLIKFEELIDSPISFIEIISSFLGIKPINNKIPTFDELKKINPTFFRSGKKDKWKSVYTKADEVAFYLRNTQPLISFGYESEKRSLPSDEDMMCEIISQNNYLLSEINTMNRMQKQTFSEKNIMVNQIRKIEMQLEKKNKQCIDYARKFESFQRKRTWKLFNIIFKWL